MEHCLNVGWHVNHRAYVHRAQPNRVRGSADVLSTYYRVLERHPQMPEGTRRRVRSNFQSRPSLIAMQVKTEQQQNRRFAYEVLFTHLCQFLLRFRVLYPYDGIRLQVSRGRSMNTSLENKLQDIRRDLLVQKIPTT
jgi:hypothetical protein